MAATALDPVAASILEFWDGESVPHSEFRLVRLDGTTVEVEGAGGAFDFNGRQEVQFIVRDISGRKQAEAARLRHQTELRVLFDLMPAMIWFKDTENRILRVNQQAAVAAGKSVAEIEGKMTEEIYPQEFARFYADDLEVIRSGTPKLEIVEVLRDRDEVRDDALALEGPHRAELRQPGLLLVEDQERAARVCRRRAPAASRPAAR